MNPSNIKYNIKYCRDCKYCVVEEHSVLINNYEFAECHHHKIPSKGPSVIELVSGCYEKEKYLYCSSHRLDDEEGYCGKRGWLWEAKQ